MSKWQKETVEMPPLKKYRVIKKPCNDVNFRLHPIVEAHGIHSYGAVIEFVKYMEYYKYVDPDDPSNEQFPEGEEETFLMLNVDTVVSVELIEESGSEDRPTPQE